MANRVVEVIIPEDRRDILLSILEELSYEEFWEEPLMDKKHRVRLLVQTEDTEELSDQLEKEFGGVEGFRTIIYSVSATLPRPDEEEEEDDETTANQKEDSEPFLKRVSREELYSNIKNTVVADWTFILLVSLSTIVAAFGVLKNDTAVVVGAMVIAPVIGPNIGLALSATLGDWELAKESMVSNVVAALASIGIPILIGYGLEVNPQLATIAGRTSLGYGDIALALSAGSAGALAFSQGEGTTSITIVGVMVAVALLPPAVITGLLIGEGLWQEAGGAFLIVMNNIICINLAGVLTFLLQGIQPLNWWEAQQAWKYTWISILIWVLLLLLLAMTIHYLGGGIIS